MANHIRRQLRELVTTKVTGLPTTAARVFASRVYPLQDADLPALLVFSQEETAQTITIHGPSEVSRRLTISIKAVAKANADLDDLLDQMCNEVEKALGAASLEPLARGMELTGTSIELEGDAEKPTGAATMNFVIEYLTASNAPDVAL